MRRQSFGQIACEAIIELPIETLASQYVDVVKTSLRLLLCVGTAHSSRGSMEWRAIQKWPILREILWGGVPSEAQSGL